MEIKKTSDYAQFQIIKMNRPIDQAHVRHLVNSIGVKNMLDIFPMKVNKKMQVFDGQHRLLAAQELGVPIYYFVDEKLEHKDIVLMNVTKPWKSTDYLNYYAELGYAEYIKLREFMQKQSINLKVAMIILQGRKDSRMQEFKEGKFTFPSNTPAHYMNDCWLSMDIIHRFKGKAQWLISSKFWGALITLIRDPNYNSEIWFKKLNMLGDRIEQRVTYGEYAKMLQDIYNYKAREDSPRVNLDFEDL